MRRNTQKVLGAPEAGVPQVPLMGSGRHRQRADRTTAVPATFGAFLCQHIVMSRAAAVDIEGMTAEERLDLIEALWNSLEDRDIDVTPAQAQELQARTDALRESRLECSGIDETLVSIRTKRVPR